MSEIIPEILSAARLLFRPGDVVELRVFKAGKRGTVSGYFNDFEALAREAATLEFCKFPGVYWTINPVDPVLLSRAINRVNSYVPAKGCTEDGDIVRRWWLPVDLDPKRPSGISSTDVQHEDALAHALYVRAALVREGWPEAIYADSGNGAHLLFPIDLPNDPESLDLVSRVLKALAARFKTTSEAGTTVEVDVTLSNASRILKMYGTTARKGDATPERPHRVSHILQVPDLIETLSVDQMRAMAATLPISSPPARAQGTGYMRSYTGRREFNLEDFMGRHGLRYRSKLPYKSGYKYQLEECPFNPEHKHPDSIIIDAEGYTFHCSHNSCADRDWHVLREHLEGPRPQRRQAPPPAPWPKEARDNSDENSSASAGAVKEEEPAAEVPTWRPRLLPRVRLRTGRLPRA